jgi:hypothetical protein
MQFGEGLTVTLRESLRSRHWAIAMLILFMSCTDVRTEPGAGRPGSPQSSTPRTIQTAGFLSGPCPVTQPVARDRIPRPVDLIFVVEVRRQTS